MKKKKSYTVDARVGIDYNCDTSVEFDVNIVRVTHDGYIKNRETSESKSLLPSRPYE